MRKISSTISTLFIGHIVNSIIDEVFYFILYPAILIYFGLFNGVVIVWILSFLICYLTILFYNWSKTDWLGIEMVKETLDKEQSSIFLKVLSWANRRGKLVVLAFLSMTTDPIISVIYMRKSHGYHKMDRRDWKVFIISFIVANIWWTTVVYTGVTIFMHIYNYTKAII